MHTFSHIMNTQRRCAFPTFTLRYHRKAQWKTNVDRRNQPWYQMKQTTQHTLTSHISPKAHIQYSTYRQTNKQTNKQTNNYTDQCLSDCFALSQKEQACEDVCSLSVCSSPKQLLYLIQSFSPQPSSALILKVQFPFFSLSRVLSRVLAHIFSHVHYLSLSPSQTHTKTLYVCVYTFAR